jgi:hypothetical protein
MRSSSVLAALVAALSPSLFLSVAAHNDGHHAAHARHAAANRERTLSAELSAKINETMLAKRAQFTNTRFTFFDAVESGQPGACGQSFGDWDMVSFAQSCACRVL